MSSQSSSGSSVKWFIATVIAILAAGGGVAAWVGLLRRPPPGPTDYTKTVCDALESSTKVISHAEESPKGLAASVGRWRRAIDDVAETLEALAAIDSPYKESARRHAQVLRDRAKKYDANDGVTAARTVPESNDTIFLIDEIRTAFCR